MPCRIIGPGGGKANEVAIEALKQLLTLSAGTLALTITFLKDALGDNRGAAEWLWCVKGCWLALALSIWAGWVAIADSQRRIAVGGTDFYVFGPGRPKILAQIAQWSFLAGLTFLVVFALKNLHLYFRDAPVTHAQTVSGDTIVVLPSVFPFVAGKTSLTLAGEHTLSTAVDSLSAMSQRRRVLEVRIVGSSDRRRLQGASTTSWSSNSALARQRAIMVEQSLRNGLGHRADGIFWARDERSPEKLDSPNDSTAMAQDRSAVIIVRLRN